jgi:hypothetical protein
VKKIAFFLAVVIALVILNCNRSIGLAYCVTANSEHNYVGKALLTSPKQFGKVMRTSECEKVDFEIDKRDGATRGKIRWIDCRNGPDCSEAALF